MPVEVLNPPLELGLALKHSLFRVGQNAIKPTQNGQRQDDILVFSSFESVPNQIRDTPYKIDNLAVVHLLNTRTAILQAAVNWFLCGSDAG